MQKTFFLLILLWPTITITHAEIEPPNYNFSLDTLSNFYPGKTLDSIKGKYKKVSLEFDKGNSKIYKTYVSHIRYKFPVFFRVYEEKSVAMFARLPSYFLHDVFHQSLINRYGKQDQYNKVGNAATYIWDNKDNLKITYQGQCTITCFPMYIAIEMVKPPESFPGSTSILKELAL